MSGNLVGSFYYSHILVLKQDSAYLPCVCCVLSMLLNVFCVFISSAVVDGCIIVGDTHATDNTDCDTGDTGNGNHDAGDVDGDV
jgi:hypothetical protein